jgi:hypothetical protein
LGNALIDKGCPTLRQINTDVLDQSLPDLLRHEPTKLGCLDAAGVHRRRLHSANFISAIELYPIAH